MPISVFDPQQTNSTPMMGKIVGTGTVLDGLDVQVMVLLDPATGLPYAASGGAGGGGGAVTVADGANVAQGTTTDLSTANTLVGLLKNVKAAVANILPKGQATSANSAPVVLASDQSALPTRLLTASDLVTIVNGNIIAQALAYDGFGNQLRGVTPTSGIYQLQVNTSEAMQYMNWNAITIAAGNTDLAPINARNFKEIAFIINVTTLTGAATIQFCYQVQDGNSVWQTMWASTAFNVTGLQAISCGPGLANAFSLGLTGRIRVIVTGTSAQVSGTIWFRT